MWKNPADDLTDLIVEEAAFEIHLLLERERVAQSIKVRELARRLQITDGMMARRRTQQNASLGALIRTAHAMGKRIKFVLVDEVSDGKEGSEA